MAVQFSCRCPNADYLGFPATPEAIIATAVRAEKLGFDAIFVNDHIIVDNSPRSAPWTNTYDPFVSLSFMAANTTRIGLGISVLIMPYRNPIVTAKMLATLDRMSGGRIIAGIGAGWSEAEFKALGVPYHERGARTNEYLRIWQACWAPDPVSFDGKFVSFADMHVSPKPLRQPHPPIWVGGLSDAALRRAARFAEIWQPTPISVSDLIERGTFLRDACQHIGREDPPETRMSFRIEYGTPTAQIASELTRYREQAGVNAFQINFHGNRDVGQLLDSMDRFSHEVRPLVS